MGPVYLSEPILLLLSSLVNLLFHNLVHLEGWEVAPDTRKEPLLELRVKLRTIRLEEHDHLVFSDTIGIGRAVSHVLVIPWFLLFVKLFS